DYNAIAPVRLLDTRTGNQVAAGGTQQVTVTGTNGIPADAEAVAVNLAAADPTTNRSLTAYPCGSAKPATSTANYDTSYATSHAAIGRVRTGCMICIYAMAPTDVITHSLHYALPISDYNAIAPVRLLDTRTGNQVAAGGTQQVTVTGTNGIPADAEAVA